MYKFNTHIFYRIRIIICAVRQCARARGTELKLRQKTGREFESDPRHVTFVRISRLKLKDCLILSRLDRGTKNMILARDSRLV